MLSSVKQEIVKFSKGTVIALSFVKQEILKSSIGAEIALSSVQQIYVQMKSAIR